MGEQPKHLKKRSRFKTEQEILDAIDLKMSQIRRLRNEAAKFDELADKAFARGHSGLAWRADADHKRDKADRIERGYLQRLKRTLAAFRTKLLPGFGEDNSIPK